MHIFFFIQNNRKEGKKDFYPQRTNKEHPNCAPVLPEGRVPQRWMHNDPSWSWRKWIPAWANRVKRESPKRGRTPAMSKRETSRETAGIEIWGFSFVSLSKRGKKKDSCAQNSKPTKQKYELFPGGHTGSAFFIFGPRNGIYTWQRASAH